MLQITTFAKAACLRGEGRRTPPKKGRRRGKGRQEGGRQEEGADAHHVDDWRPAKIDRRGFYRLDFCKSTIDPSSPGDCKKKVARRK